MKILKQILLKFINITQVNFAWDSPTFQTIMTIMMLKDPGWELFMEKKKVPFEQNSLFVMQRRKRKDESSPEYSILSPSSSQTSLYSSLSVFTSS